jgi:hypothetical protein
MSIQHQSRENLDDALKQIAIISKTNFENYHNILPNSMEIVFLYQNRLYLQILWQLFSLLKQS